MSARRLSALVMVSAVAAGMSVSTAGAEELVIAASPTVAGPLQALGRAFESLYPDVKVRLAFSPGLAMRQTIATVENRGPYFIGTGPIHLVAPGGDELITRLQQKYYLLPGTGVTYATVPLVLVVPESLVEAPASFESLAQHTDLRIAIADPTLTTLGRQTIQFLRSLGLAEGLNDRFDVAADAPAVLDHLLHGRADVAIVYGPDAIRERERVRVIAMGEPVESITHSMAMSRSCPNRRLCEQFLTYLQSAGARKVVGELGYGPLSVTP